MRYLTGQFNESEVFYQRYYYPNITFKEFVYEEMFAEEPPIEFEEARGILEAEYESLVKNYFNDKIYYYTELSKHIFNEKGEIIPLNDYNFFKLRMYATKVLIKSDEADNAIKEEINKIKDGNYPAALKELVRCTFHDYEVEFCEDGDGIIASYYLGEEEPCYIYRFEKVQYRPDFIIDQRFCSIIYEEVFEENGKITYNILTPSPFEDCYPYSDISIEFMDINLIKACNDTFSMKKQS
ncbi:hypothetical protein SAMN02746066_03722 [Anaerosporobacter mobilis DSM 15930]|jgi:hypothetical protein|uniref:Uncharacterized protein n=1 Tax=Anaerosporobacter mobilis DSM 15930 TaxID=1120996 RepID=A0A1M7MB65_9FIRM|nr:hypothetical protein [Anaerosporobacter mobilis]SHM88034.1 hypothetical protein SAMN02746066_03722 [Anaerosporobacter mobilis DSM 15930]